MRGIGEPATELIIVAARNRLRTACLDYVASHEVSGR